MGSKVRIDLETAKQLTTAQELGLVREAYQRNPSAQLRGRLARLLMLRDDFDEMIALLAKADDMSARDHLMLAEAWLTHDTPDDNRQARLAASRAYDRFADPNGRAEALACRGKAERRLGDEDAARASFTTALDLDPANKDACKRLTAMLLETGDSDGVLALADRLLASGAAHSRLFAAAMLAHARRGDLAAARATVTTTDTLFHARTLQPPPGWTSIEAFNAALAEELLQHPELRFERYGTASELTWRIDSPLTRSAPLMHKLLEQISGSIASFIDGLDDADHAWTKAKPRDAWLRSWCVITDSDGYETWHVHQFGWLSGSYYVQVPDSISQGTDEAGCIAFGLPADLAGDESARAFGTDLVRPRSGLMLMFPSHLYHRTFPHGGRQRRICVAFDLRPA